MKRRRNGEGSYYRNSSGAYVYACRYVDPLTGKKKRKAITAATKEKLDEKVSIWKKNLAAKESPEKMTVGDWCEQFLRNVKPTVKTKTFASYDGNIRNHIIPALGTIKLKDLSPSHVQAMINDLHSSGLSPETTATVRRVLSVALNQAVAYWLIPDNPVNATKPPRIEKKLPVVLNKEQIIALLDAADKCEFLPKTDDDSRLYLRRCYFTLLCIAIDSGCRIGELLALRWMDLQQGRLYIRRALEGNKIGTPKTESSYRAVTLSKSALGILKDFCKYQLAYCDKWGFWKVSDNSLIFANSWGTIIYLQNLSKRWWKPLLKAACIPVGFRWHNLRATSATQLLQSGIPVKAVSERLGHSNVSVTLSKYAGIVRGIEEQAAIVMDGVIGKTKTLPPPPTDSGEE